ncbi:3-dehydrosphinganine reductase-like [Onthophagus taurus]|uniref:3-dehydrosphinganine reductase-like n=1 Tax=Onthophagus taurus TaxID=166361 RepID=UPI0039BE40BF
MGYFIFALTLILPVLAMIFIKKLDLWINYRKSIERKHVVITGGSSGIGKSLALLAARKGADVTIIARDLTRLEDTEKELENMKLHETQTFKAISMDVTNNDKVNEIFNEIDNKNPIYMLINCAGCSIAGTIEDTPFEEAKNVMNVNYFGSFYPIQAVVPKMKRRKKGIIVLCGSQSSLFGFFGYSVYASSKFALRGLAEVLDMEVKPHDITVTFALPPDTYTPGFVNELKSKPEATKIISGTGGIYEPDVVAERILKDALNNKFFSYVGTSSFMLANLCSGMSPTTIYETIYQCFLLGYLKIIGSIYLKIFQNTVKSLNVK